MRTLRLGGLVLLAALFVTVGAATSQDKKPISEKHDSRALVESLRDVINAGADLFNQQGDYAGCYRVYQGALISIKPFLAPDLQGRIDQSISKAEKMAKFSDRAFALREVIDEIRAQGKGAPDKKGETMKINEPKKVEKKTETVEPLPKEVDKKPIEKKTIDKKPVEKEPEVKKEKTATISGKDGQLEGKVTYNGKPAPPGFLTLVSKESRRFSTSIQPDGTYKFKTPLPPGRYVIAIERVPGAQIGANLDIPERYRSDATSGLTVEVSAGRMAFDVTLVR